MKRVVVPEILDGLPADDPGAQKSRRDLRRINALMGNERWILRRLKEVPEEVLREGVVEWGAGGGDLARKLVAAAGCGRVEAVDLVAEPEGGVKGVVWRQGDLFRVETEGKGVLVANLFLHHFEGESLEEIGRMAARFRMVIAVEPWRSRWSLGMGSLMWPWVHPVTRHDMMASIRAGFEPGELAKAWGAAGGWRFSERRDWRGGLGVVGWRV